jgi:glyceraldehyde 3-phosphate dehydrogenase
MVNIALNGFGRIGKSLLRVMLSDQRCKGRVALKAINVGPADVDMTAYFLKFDSVMGPLRDDPYVKDSVLYGVGDPITLLAEKDITKDLWKQHEVDWVIDVSGHYTDREHAQIHIDVGGARGVVISAPAHGDDVTIIMGINEDLFDRKKHTIVSLGSCTTNAVVPLIDIVEKKSAIAAIMISTTHAYTNSQSLLDSMLTGHDLRRSRAACLNIVPSDTGAVAVVKRLYPHLADCVAGSALRVPVPVSSIADVVFELSSAVSEQEWRSWFEDAARERLKSIIAVNNLPLVSSDFEGNTYSAVVDMSMTHVAGKLGKVMAWYDNEYGYSSRVCDFMVKHLV